MKRYYLVIGQGKYKKYRFYGFARLAYDNLSLQGFRHLYIVEDGKHVVLEEDAPHTYIPVWYREGR